MLRTLIILLVSLLLTNFVAAQPTISPKASFITLSDFHFDPFISCHNQTPCPFVNKLRKAPATEWSALFAEYDKVAPVYRQDTGYVLLKSALASAGAVAKTVNAEFVLILGDFLSHEYRDYYIRYSNDNSITGYQTFVRKTFAFLVLELQHTFPNINVYPVVGNNDSYARDYVTHPHSQFFQDFPQLWAPLIKNSATRQTLQADFQAAGYYAITLPAQKNIRLIVLNTNLFAKNAEGKGVDKAALAELNWLHHELEQVKTQHQRAMIAMHIPEGIDIYLTIRYKLMRVMPLWNSDYIQQFQAQLQQYAPNIMGLFAGHLHADWFHVLTFNNADEIPVNGTSSVSPVFGNNPSFKIISFTPERGVIDDYVTYYYPLSKDRAWGVEYDYDNIYQKNCRFCKTTDMTDQLARLSSLRNFYLYFRQSKQKEFPVLDKWYPAYWCLAISAGTEPYKQCKE